MMNLDQSSGDVNNTEHWGAGGGGHGLVGSPRGNEKCLSLPVSKKPWLDLEEIISSY